MMDNLLLHTHSRAQLTALAQDPPHALLLIGPFGLGKRTIAEAWGRLLTDTMHVMVVEPDEKGTISIDTVRNLYTRTRSRQEKRQVVIVDHAEAMGIEAQNAFLKLLEEPPAGVTFVLTTPSIDSLLPTITSRTQALQLQRVSSALLQKWITKQGAQGAQALAQLLFVADGRPATAARLMQNETLFAHYRDLMHQAKQLLTVSGYERLCSINKLTANKDDLIIVLEAMAHMVKAQLASGKAESRWLKLANGLELCLAKLAQNGNPRAQLTNFFVSY